MEEQARQRKRWPRMLAVGTIVGLAILGLLTGVFRFVAGTSIFSKTLHIVSYVDNAAGLLNGAVVSLNGVRIGNVTDVGIPDAPPNPAQPIRIDMRISAQHPEWLRQDSVVQIATSGPMGDAAINIEKGTPDSPPATDGTVLPARAATPATAVVISAHTLLENTNLLVGRFTTMAPRLKSGTVGKLMGPNDVSQRMDEIERRGDAVRHALTSGNGSMARLMSDPLLLARLQHTQDSAHGVGQQMAADGSMGLLLHDSRLPKDVAGLKAGITTASGNFKQRRGAAGKLVNDPATVAELHSIAAGFRSAGAGKGSLSQLTSNPELPRRKADLATRIHELVHEMHAHPGKFFRIHLDLF